MVLALWLALLSLSLVWLGVDWLIAQFSPRWREQREWSMALMRAYEQAKRERRC